MEMISENRAFGGTQGVFRHNAHSCHCDMTFGLFLPEEAQDGPVAGDLVSVRFDLHP